MLLCLQNLNGQLFGHGGETWWEEGGQLNTILSTCEGWNPQTSQHLALVFSNWGFICLKGLEMLWKCVGVGLCMRWETCWEERGSVTYTTIERSTMCKTIWRFVIPIGTGKMMTCLLLENRLGNTT